MVNVVVAGSTGIARHIAEAIKATGRHYVVVFSRQDNHSLRAAGIPVQVVDYNNHQQLVRSLGRAHTVISALDGPGDGWFKSQGNLLKAAVEAGVRRFAPCDFGPMPGPVNYSPRKDIFARELGLLNSRVPVIEITHFKCGYLADQFCTPYRTTYIRPCKPFIDFENCEAIIPGAGDSVLVVTQVNDLAQFVAAALDIPEGRWPPISGVVGQRLTLKDLVRLAESIRGRPFKVFGESTEMLKAGIISSVSEIRPSPNTSRPLTIPFLLALAYGQFDVPPTLNLMFPHMKATPLRDFLASVWSGRPAR